MSILPRRAKEAGGRAMRVGIPVPDHAFYPVACASESPTIWGGPWPSRPTLTTRSVDRRRIELVEPGVPNMPMHHESHQLDDAATKELIAQVRASATRATFAAFDDLAPTVASIALRTLRSNFPTDITTLKRAPYESRADAVMYREVLAECARARGWDVTFYDAKTVESQAAAKLGKRADEILRAPRATLGPPWTKDHRAALAATIV